MINEHTQKKSQKKIGCERQRFFFVKKMAGLFIAMMVWVEKKH